MNKVQEIYEFTYNKITVVVKIDYIRNKISLMEHISGGAYKEKLYNFSGRGVEYMDGWLNIMEAMQEAVKDAKKRYEKNLAEVSEFKKDEMIEYLITKEI